MLSWIQSYFFVFHFLQFEREFVPQHLCNWEVPKQYRPTPLRRKGCTKVISNDRGHLLPGISKYGVLAVDKTRESLVYWGLFPSIIRSASFPATSLILFIYCRLNLNSLSDVRCKSGLPEHITEDYGREAHATKNSVNKLNSSPCHIRLVIENVDFQGGKHHSKRRELKYINCEDSEREREKVEVNQ